MGDEGGGGRKGGVSTNIKFNAFQCKKEFVDRRQKERDYLLTSRNEPTTTTELELLKGQQQKKGMDVGARLCGHEGEGGGLECTPCYAMCAAADAALVHRSAMQTRGSLDLTRTAVSMFTVYLKNWPSTASFSFVLIFSNKHYNFDNN